MLELFYENNGRFKLWLQKPTLRIKISEENKVQNGSRSNYLFIDKSLDSTGQCLK